MIIGVIGGGVAGSEALEQAESVGRVLAERGCILICGGLGGVMEAACKGAREAGGETIGVLPGEDPSDANPYVSIPIVSGVGRARNLIVVLSSQALIAVDGGYGTLSEIGFALQYGRPVVGLSTWTISAAGAEDLSIYRTDDPVEAVQHAISAAGNLTPHPSPTSERGTQTLG